MSELRKNLEIDEWLELVKEDKNLNGAYISFAQYIDILEIENQQLKSQVKQIKDNNEELKRRLRLVQKKRDSYKFRYRDVCKKLKQRDEVIDEALKLNEKIDQTLKCKNTNAYYEMDDIIFEQYQILQKYKGDNNE